MIRLGKLWYSWAIQEVEGHFVHDLGAIHQRAADQEDYEEGSGENVSIVDVFEKYENWSSSLVGGQLDDIDFGLSEDKGVLDA